DLRGVEAALQHAPADDARTKLARARLLQARGRFDEARTLYQAASEEPGHRVPALVHQAAMELEQGNAARAVELSSPLLTAHPNHPDVVPVAVEAQLGEEHAEEAMALVTPALERHPRDAPLRAAKAELVVAHER
ncbi:MAG: tetratricopeptide repeat protein, partial [Sandaracinaceae bacterium]